MKIAHFGTFDVENYGDLLFPLILERRLSDVCREFVHVSPVGGHPVWGDCVGSVAADELLHRSPGLGGVVVGGGNIVHAAPGTVESYDRGGLSPLFAYPSLWLGAAYTAARDDLPFCLNGPGVPRAFGPVGAQLIRWTASVADYISVRDRASRGFLEESEVPRQSHVVPDTALEVSRLWSEDEISDAYANAFARRNRSVPERTLAFHLTSRYVDEAPEAIASRIDRICGRLRATAILIAIGPVHGDGGLQRQVAQRMTTEPLLVERPNSLREVAACIALSEAYIGSSLHGMITACSFGRRSLLVAWRSIPKFGGFLEQFQLSDWQSESWAEAERRVGDLFAEPIGSWGRVLEAAAPALDQHWARMRAALTQPQKLHKRHMLEGLRSIGEERFGEGAIFQGIVAENAMNLQAALRSKNQQLEQKTRDVEKLARWIEQLDAGAAAVLDSRQLKIGYALSKLYRRVLFKPPPPPPPKSLSRVRELFRAWQKDSG